MMRFGLLRKSYARTMYQGLSQSRPALAGVSIRSYGGNWDQGDQQFGGGGRGGGMGGGGGFNHHEQNRMQKSARETQSYFDIVNRTRSKPVPPVRVSERELFGVSTNSGGDMTKYDGVEVDVMGDNKDDHSILEHFDDITGIPNFLKKNIERSQYTTPSPVQKYAIEPSLAGRDVIVTAQTGSGKTASFLIPAITSMFVNAPDVNPADRAAFIDEEGRCAPIALILAPTRELAVQIHQDALRFTFGSPFRAASVYGGAGALPQMEQMSNGAHIMVATPGRLSDFLQRGVISLKQCRFLVLDEADRMLDMGFEPQVRDIMFNHDLRKSAEGLQTLMFSATMPQNIRRLTMDLMRNIISISVGRVGATSDLVKQNLIQCDHSGKEEEALNLIKEGEKTLMFVNRKANCDWMVRLLNRRGITAVAIHGDLAQRARESSIHAFKTGRASVLVGTDVAARGLDIPNVKHVINFDLPNSIDDYVHRIGRTGRAGNTGVATSLVVRGGGQDGNDSILPDLLKCFQESKEEVPDWLADFANSSRGRMGGYRGTPRSRPGQFGKRGEQGSSHFRDSYGNNSSNGGQREERGWNNRSGGHSGGGGRDSDFDYRNRY